MQNETVITNRKIFFMFLLTFFYFLCSLFLGFMQFSKPDIILDTTFDKVIMIIANFAVIFGFLLLLGLCYSYLVKWPIRFTFIEGTVKIEYILSGYNKILKLNEIKIVSTFKQSHNYPWYDYFMIIEMNSGELKLLYYLPSSFVRNIVKEIGNDKRKVILAGEFGSLVKRAKGKVT